MLQPKCVGSFKVLRMHSSILGQYSTPIAEHHLSAVACFNEYFQRPLKGTLMFCVLINYPFTVPTAPLLPLRMTSK